VESSTSSDTAGLLTGDRSEVYTGRRVDLLNMQEDDIDIIDIAHALSLQCRYNGHCKTFYSVGLHSISVCLILRQLGASRATEFAGLLHDAAEAYLSDLPRPLKTRLPNYVEAERRLQGIIYRKYLGDRTWDAAQVKTVDDACCKSEAQHLMKSGGAGWMFPPALPTYPFILDAPAQVVEKMFIHTFHALQESLP